jgi:hypothetical protein
MKKLLVLAIALSGLIIAGPKKYEFSLSTPASVGSVQLAAGDYTVQVEGSSAVITNRETEKSFTTPVKVETSEKKYDVTAVQSTHEGNTAQLRWIELGGSKTKLDFE